MARLVHSPTVEVSTDISAPVSDVWDLVTDINLPAQFSDEFLGAEWLDNEPAVGARFLGKNKKGKWEWETTSWISEYEPFAAFGWAVNDLESPVATWTFYLTTMETGTRLRYLRVLGQGESALTRLIERHPEREEEFIAVRDEEHRIGMQSVIDGIKALAES